MLWAFATLSVALAAVGLYAVLSFAVARQRREFGVRAALGADRARLLRFVLWQGLSSALVGLAIGTLAASLLAQLMTSLLFGITPLDPAAYAVAPLLLLSVAALACLGPALQAARVEPWSVLRGL